MAWYNVGAAAVGVIGSSMSSDKNGGAGATSGSKEPWANAQPLLVQSLNQAYGLGQQYQQSPFSPAQTAAYGNSARLSDYGRQVVPSLLGQLGQQPLGYDKNNPNARPQAFDWKSALLANPQPVAQQQATPAAPAQVAAQQPAYTSPTSFNPANLNVFERQAYGSMAPGSQERAQFEATRQSMPGIYSNNDYTDPMWELLNQRRGQYALLGNGGGWGGPSTGVDGIGVAGSDAAVGSAANF